MKLAEVGYFSKTHGLKGHLQLNVSTDFDIENCNALFVKLPGAEVPHFISDFRENKNGFILLLEELNTIEKVKDLVGKKVFVNGEYIFQDDTKDLIGYMVIDEEFGEVGKVSELEDNGADIILIIDHKGKQVMLPMNDDLVQDIDDATRSIKYKAPKGLIEMYLS